MNIQADRTMQDVTCAIDVSRGTGQSDYYRELRHILKLAGCFELAPWVTLFKISFLTCVSLSSYLLLLSEPSWMLRSMILLLLASSHAQCAFLAHDAVHRTLTRKPWLAELLGQLMATFFNGLSYSYFFKHNHMRHHAHCGEETVDPEMQSDIFGFYEDAARTKRGLCRHTSRYQAGLIWVMVTLNGFSVRNEGIKFMWRNPRATRIDRLAAFLHFVMWLIVPIYFLGLWHAILNYFIFTWLIGVYLMGIILFYHVGCRVIRSDETISAFRRQVEGTRNMGTSWLVELYAAGTNNHIEHHLFPDIPTARLRRARDITRAFCNRHAIEYKEMGYRSAVRDVTRHMSALSRHVPSVVRQ